MKKNSLIRQIALVSLSTLLLSACGGGNARQVLGLDKEVPDEFRVISQAPLAVPPDFHLRPPKPGSKRPYHQDLDEQAKDVLFSHDTPSSASNSNTSSEQGLLGQITAQADPDIRKTIEEENRKAAVQVEEKGFFDKIADYTRGNKKKQDPTVDASQEKERISKKKRDGETITGDDTPEIESKSEGGFLNRILGW